MRFLMPAMFWSLMVLAVPVLIHLSRRRVHKQVELGTLRFLQSGSYPRKRRMRIEDWLLMLMRVVAMALLCFLFLRPFFPANEAERVEADETLILIDGSGSMTAEMADEAKRIAKKVMRDGKTPTYRLLQFSDDVRVLDSLENHVVHPGAPTDFPRALQWSLDECQQRRAAGGRVVLIGHLAGAAELRQASLIWPPNIAVEIHPIQEPEEKNLAVREVNLLTPFALEKMDIEIVLDKPDASPPLDVLISAEGVNETVTVPAGRSSVMVSLPISREVLRGTVKLMKADPWPTDNERPFSFAWVKQKRVLLVDGKPGATVFDGQAYFLQKALSASGAAHGKSAFRCELQYGLEDQNGSIDLQAYDAVALCGWSEISEAAATALKEFVERGGALIHVLADEHTIEASETLVRSGLLPSAMKYEENESLRAITSFDEKHPSFARFADRENGDLTDLPWQQRFVVEAHAEWVPKLTMDHGVPLAWEKVSKNGRIFLLAHPLNRDWTDAPRNPIFVPFVKAMFGGLTGLNLNQSVVREVHPGEKESRAIGYYNMPGNTMDLVTAHGAESQVSSWREEEFRTMLGLPSENQPAPAVASILASDAPGISRPREWWPWIAATLLLFLLIENIFSFRKHSHYQKSTV